jgi:DNA-binding IclR family transcriptional regulator
MIQSLRRGLEVLEFMAGRGGAATVSEAARFLDVDRSTSSRLLATLEGRGFVARGSETQAYRLGSKLLVLSKVLLDSLSVASASQDDIQALADRTGEAAHVAILVGQEAVFVNHVDGHEALTISTSVGDRDPLYCTAIGRALLLGMPDAGVRALLRGVKLIPYTRKTTTTIVGVLERLRAFRAQGYAFDDEERHAGVQCLAAPVRDHHGDVVGAIGISAPTLRVVKAGENVFAEAVLEAARSLSARLGFAAE